MKIELRKLADIRPYDKNPRLNDNAVAAVAASIREFGFRQPIVVDTDGVIICGHTRYKAAQKLGLEKVPVHVAKDLTPEQIKAYRIADNKTGELAEWNYDLLPIELSRAGRRATLTCSCWASTQTSWPSCSIRACKEGLTDPDEVPEPPDEAITQPGDLWILGDHRLLCGDSSKPEDVDRLLDGAEIHLVNTDPPYNVKVEPRSNNAIAAGTVFVPGHQASPEVRRRAASRESQSRRSKKLRAKDRPLGKRLRHGRGVRRDAATRGSATWLACWCRSRLLHLGRLREPRELSAGAQGDGLVFLAGHRLGQACIRCSPARTSSGASSWRFYGWREGAGTSASSDRNNVPDLWHVKKIHPQQMVHLTEKPAELAVRAIQYSSRRGRKRAGPVRWQRLDAHRQLSRRVAGRS